MKCLSTCLFIGSASAEQNSREYYEKKFFVWMKEYLEVPVKKSELFERLEAFADNDDFITAHNANSDENGYTLGHNAFSHLTWSEFKSNYFGLKMPADHLKNRQENAQTSPNLHGEALPDSIDWVALGKFYRYNHFTGA